MSLFILETLILQMIPMPNKIISIQSTSSCLFHSKKIIHLIKNVNKAVQLFVFKVAAKLVQARPMQIYCLVRQHANLGKIALRHRSQLLPWHPVRFPRIMILIVVELCYQIAALSSRSSITSHKYRWHLKQSTFMNKTAVLSLSNSKLLKWIQIYS